MPRSLGELAERVGGTVRGNPGREISAIRPLDTAGPGDLSFVTHPKYRAQAETSRAGALLVAGEEGLSGRDLLIAADPEVALIALLELLHPARRPPAGIHPTAVVDERAEVDAGAHVGPFAVVGAGSRVEAGAVLGAHVVVGRDCRVGRDAWLHPHAVLYDRTELGERVVVHAGTVLGSDGFGYVFRDGVHVKEPQVGRVVVEDDVEIGANSAIDRAKLETTRIGAGSKIDNLVQVGHNVQIGRAVIVCGQAGLGGSSRVGDGSVLAGRVGVADHVELGEQVTMGGGAVAFQSVEAGRVIAGSPAVDIGKWRRQVALIQRLEEMKRRLGALEKKVQSLS